jgi:hypothetical protein
MATILWWLLTGAALSLYYRSCFECELLLAEKRLLTSQTVPCQPAAARSAAAVAARQ